MNLFARQQRASLGAQTVKNLPAVEETQVGSLRWEDPLEKEMATHSSIPAWRIPWTEELEGYSPRGCNDLDTTEYAHTHKSAAGEGGSLLSLRFSQ